MARSKKNAREKTLYNWQKIKMGILYFKMKQL